MIGSIIGDTVGSIYEFNNIKTKDFDIFQPRMSYTDDSILTVATAEWLLEGGEVAQYYYDYAISNSCPMGGFGGMFVRWIQKSRACGLQPAYGSCGNGSAMRVSPVGWACDSEAEVLRVAAQSAACTHNHPEGIKGAQATALAIFLARKGVAPQEIAQRITADFGYDLSMSVDEIRPRYSWEGLDDGAAGSGATCQGTVPQALVCALTSTSFEDAIRNAVSIGGDSDTLGAITGGVAQAMHGVPQDLRSKVWNLLPQHYKDVITRFEQRYGC